MAHIPQCGGDIILTLSTDLVLWTILSYWGKQFASNFGNPPTKADNRKCSQCDLDMFIFSNFKIPGNYLYKVNPSNKSQIIANLSVGLNLTFQVLICFFMSIITCLSHWGIHLWQVILNTLKPRPQYGRDRQIVANWSVSVSLILPT